MKHFIISIFLLIFVPCFSQRTIKKVYLPSYRIIHCNFLKTVNNIAARYNQNNNNIFIIYMQGSCRVYVWMLDKKNVMYDPDTFGYTIVGKHVFFLQKDKNQNILIPHNGSKRLFNFLDTKIPPMTDGVFEWVYNISGDRVKLLRFISIE